MFPTTHDITPEHLEPCLEVIGKLIAAGNRLLIVSKPHIDCIKKITWRFWELHCSQILFRFTIGAMDDEILSYWEPGAPTFSERKTSLMHACSMGFATSVSIEPMLDSPHIVELVNAVSPYVTDTIWIGKMKQVRARAMPGTSEAAIRRVEAGQTDERIREIYADLKDHSQIRWKDSFKSVVGVELATAAGLDV